MLFQPPRVKTKPISVTHSQQNISVPGGSTQRSVSVQSRRDQPAPVSAQPKADRGCLHTGSPRLAKSLLTHGLSRG